MAVNERATQQQSHYCMNAFIYELVKIAKQHRKLDQWLPGQSLQKGGPHLPWGSSSRLCLEKVFMVYTISINLSLKKQSKCF